MTFGNIEPLFATTAAARFFHDDWLRPRFELDRFGRASGARLYQHCSEVGNSRSLEACRSLVKPWTASSRSIREEKYPAIVAA